MQYENPQPDEGINYTDEHPLKEFAQLVIGIAFVLVITIAVLTYLAGSLARYIPFDYERNMVSQIDYFSPTDSPTRQSLQELAERLAAHMALPDDMSITVHYDDGETVNALATLGGNIVVFKGLVDQLESEQALAMVLAHEVAHVKLRHPIVATGRGLTLATLAAFISGASSSRAGDWLLGSSINLQMMTFSRQQELAADEWAAHALFQEYGDISGAKTMFEKFAQQEEKALDRHLAVEAFRSHPYSKNRWLALVARAKEQGWPQHGDATPLMLTTD